MPLNKLQEGDLNFIGGMNSSLDPSSLPPGYYPRSMNMVNRGGIVQCRPGYRCLQAFPEGRLQGHAIFKPKVGPEVLLFGVEGLLYQSRFPFREFSQMANVKFSPTARQLYFEQAEQSVVMNPDNSFRLIAPRNIMVIQDGGFTPAGVFDGTRTVHDTNIPLGGPMLWLAERLWVAQGSRLFGSDIANPISFTEQLYISSVASFVFSHDITALARTPTIEFAQLLVFTNSNTSLLQVGIRDRTQWVLTPDFQKIVFPTVGAVSQRSVCVHHGMLWWFSTFGLTNFDAAAQGNVSSALAYEDDAMAESKGRLSQDLTGVACCSYENYLLVSVPYAHKYNTHTWVIDQTPLNLKGQREAPAWNSVWTGTRPVEWLSRPIAGENRCLYISADYDGVNRLWEAFTPDREDSGCPITWYMESRAMNCKIPGKFKEFRYADVFLSELLGEVDIAVFWAGSHRGKYKRILTKKIRASKGILAAGKIIKSDQLLFACKKQSRHLRTQDGKAIIADETLSSCGIELRYLEFKDEAFQLLIVGSGPGAVRGFLAYLEPPCNDDDSGRVEEDENEENFVRFDGAATEAANVDEAQAELSEDIPVFTSTRTVTTTVKGHVAIGTGVARSVISQSDADKIATKIANRRAAYELEKVLPRTVSIGLGIAQ